MWRQNNAIDLSGLLKVLHRRKTAGRRAFVALAVIGMAGALIRSPRYESQVILERKPTHVTPVLGKQEDERFDIYRLTSESQWSVALIKSRFILEKWMEAIGIQPHSASNKEDELR